MANAYMTLCNVVANEAGHNCGARCEIYLGPSKNLHHSYGKSQTKIIHIQSQKLAIVKARQQCSDFKHWHGTGEHNQITNNNRTRAETEWGNYIHIYSI